MISRRSLLQGFVATTAGLIVPDVAPVPPERRVWALDRTQLGPSFHPMADWAELLEPGETPVLHILPRGEMNFNSVQRFDYRLRSDGERIWVTDIHPDGSLTVMRWGADNLPTTTTIAPGDANGIGDPAPTAQTTADRLYTRSW